MSFKPVVHPNARLVSHTLELTDEALLKEISDNSVVEEMQQKVRAEDERLARLLPEPAFGFIWVLEVEWLDDMLNNRILLQVNYRQVEHHGY